MRSLRQIQLASLCFVILYSAVFGIERRNIILIVSDDHRYDFLGFRDDAPEFLGDAPFRTGWPNREPILRNAFVTTSLCSPSRASILTGQYMHNHRVVDNQRPVPAGTRFFPEALQRSGYETGFVGKWHMGHDPR